MRARAGAAVLAALAFLANPDAAQGESDRSSRELVVYATSDTDGELAAPRCRENPMLTGDRLPYARQVGYVRRMAPELRADDRAFTPVALHLGDASHPGPLGRFLLSRGTEGARTLARILAEMPYTSMTLGNRELALDRSSRRAFAEGASAEGLALRALNVVCDPNPEESDDALCNSGALREMQSHDVVERGDLRILLVSLVDPVVREQIASARLEGLELLPPAVVLERRLQHLRERTDADLVFLQYHASTASSLESLVELSRSAPGIDLLTTNRQLSETGRRTGSDQNGFLRAPGSGTYIVSAGRGPSHASVSRLELQRRDGEGRGDWKIAGFESTRVDTSSAPPDPSTAERLWRASEQLCRTWGEPLAPNAPLKGPFGRRDFTTFVLNVMRHLGRSEVALVNDGAVLGAENHFPLEHTLTFADIFTLLPYDNSMVVLKVRGEHLRSIARNLDLGRSARAVGLEVTETDVLVNGRPIRDDHVYNVATNRFVADGGDGIVDSEQVLRRRRFNPDWSEQPPSISETVVRFVRSGMYAGLGPGPVHLSPDGIFPDLHRRLRWALVGSLDLSFNRVGVTNPTVDEVPVYNQSQLQVDPTQQLDLEGAFQANADSENHEWDNDLLLQYGLARVGSSDDSDFDETSDLVRLRTRYKYAGFRSLFGAARWAPLPTAELQLETEFDDPPDRDWHKFEVTGIVGPTFQVSDLLELRGGFDLRRDINEPGAETVYGVTAAYRLRRTTLADLIGHPVEFESELEYFFNDPFDEQLHEIRTTSRIFFALMGDLHFTSTFSAFVFRSSSVGSFGRNTELTVGLNYRWDETIQTF